MPLDVERSEWKRFFELLTRDFADWEITIHILNERAGAQTWSGLPFKGLTYEDEPGSELVTVVVGIGSLNLQRHTILKPTKVTFTERRQGPAGMLDIEDTSGANTLITFFRPGWKVER